MKLLELLPHHIEENDIINECLSPKIEPITTYYILQSLLQGVRINI